MIPRKIHYCWFGTNKLPESTKKYIQTWKKYLPDFEIILWNEENFDINLYSYARDAYVDGKFAFVADVCRAHVLYHEGGIYLDTDVEVLKSLEPLLEHTAFAGFEVSTLDIVDGTKEVNLQMGVIGSEKNSLWVGKILSHFEYLKYYKDNAVTINSIVDSIVIEQGFELKDEFQCIEDYLCLYPSACFIAKDYQTGIINTSSATFCIHHYDATWLGFRIRAKTKLKHLLISTLNEDIFKKLIIIKRKIIK
ncbi:glycosyltransferase family 32 protein [Psychrobacter piscatorii]|uniref:glycosyltransferase family 32 protein n=1 Tax=Psychrobacter piscatorii TaxID=554343 RepID=UPI0019183698|nr:glycosyltransferase [Psychrobacter piscatorii]